MIPTAKDFIKIYLKNNPEATYDLCMVEFAKLHVEAALKEAIEKADVGCDFGSMSMKNGSLFATFAGNIGKVIIKEESILNAYPSTNIK